MTVPAPDQFWTRIAEAGLVDAERIEALRTEFAIESLSPAASPEAVTEAIARWLVRRKVLTLWQARKLARGERGPFFIGDYRLVERLEKQAYQGGGKGRLFRARHEPSGRGVLLMVLDPERCRDLAVWTDIVRRTTAANRAADPALSRTWALEQSGGQRFIVCEDVGGAPLTAELAARGPRPITEAGPLVLAIARAVGELHRLGVVHGGISVETLRREAPAAGDDPATGRVRLLQFPLVADPHLVPPRPAIDAPEAVRALATRASFLAPELLLPNAVCDPRSDVYALGCVLHALLVGALPCWQGDAERTLAQVASVGPTPLGPPLVPVEAATLVSYMVARDPAARYQSAPEAADAIAACLGLPAVSPALPAQEPLIGAPVEAVPPRVATAGTPGPVRPLPASRRPAGRPARRVAYGAGLVALAAVVAGALFVAMRRPPIGPARATGIAAKSPAAAAAPASVPPQRKTAEASPAAPEREPTADTAGDLSAPRLVDDPNLPWASPTDGPPPTLAHLPPGSQLVLLARPANLLASDEGGLLVRALGAHVERALAAVAAACGCAIQEIELVQAGWQADLAAGAAAVVGGYAAHGRQALPVADDDHARAQAWGTTKQRDVGGETVHEGAALSYWLPRSSRGCVLVAAPDEMLQRMVTAHGAGRERTAGAGWRDRLEATLPPDLEELVGMLDETRHLTVFGSPTYLLHDGRAVFAGPLAKLVEPLGAVLGSESAAAALSVHCSETFYLELDTIARAAKSARNEASDLARRVAGIAEAVEEYCNELDPHPYGRRLVMRLPAMAAVLAANIRSGAEGKGVVVNCHLPRHAGHNLALAAELAIEQTPDAADPPAAVPPASASRSPAERLAKRISLAFARDTLEKSMQMISEEIGVPIEILGKDLELEGITKNQSFALDEQEQPAEAILRTILARSNPDGKLVYVFRTREGFDGIEITTRAAAAKRGDEVPAAFAGGREAGKKGEATE